MIDVDIPSTFTQRTDRLGTFHFRYSVKIMSGSSSAGSLILEFFPPGQLSAQFASLGKFEGFSTGAPLGEFDIEGSAEFDLPLQAISGWDASFKASGLFSGGMRCEIEALDGRPVGIVSGNGADLASPTLFGQGTFKTVPAVRVFPAGKGSALQMRPDTDDPSDGSKLKLAAVKVRGETRWRLVEAGGGFFMIAYGDSERVIEVNNFSEDDGSKLQLWRRNGGDNQLWFFARRSDFDENAISIVNKHSLKAIDIPNGDIREGALLQQWKLHGGSNQQWRI